ncbi:GPI2-domain-containing protein [Aspergillus steynii IBT 23096]|uniref:GPI2-domain-containing protein n=1 Tax=Aspergillus steynii IBT 23096 TaxID=1392250 RepID=A0A2I2GI35_9EURO|nr:GPI2-domain-containing protein [Aspergillus steynii IBT 23096]PLB52548.1 GPI2-domain-containing protein [Aspergillus steynii IBT 23096]
MVIVQLPPIFGPDRPFPPPIVDVLNGYHRENGARVPPFAYKGRPVSQSKVFDRQGKELDLSLFSILEPCPYKVLVLHHPGEWDRLVTCHLPYTSKHGTYLVAWLGVEKGYEADCCAVRIFNRDLNAIRFSDEKKDTSTRSTPRRRVVEAARKANGVNGTNGTNGTANGATNGRTANAGIANKNGTSNSQANANANAKTNTTANAADSESEYETDSGSDESEETSDEEESSCLPPTKKVKTAPERPIALSTQGSVSPAQQRALPDPTRLAPEDAYFSQALTRTRSADGDYDDSVGVLNGAASVALRPAPAVPGRKDSRKVRGTSRRRRKGAWKKLLWVKQSYPDNYTDTETFLDHLQRNPRVRPYDFWPLVADSTVIVQHVCSVIIFVCCFVGIVQGRVSPVSVVCWGSAGSAIGWILWDSWMLREHGEGSSSMTSSGNPSGVWSHGQKDGQVHGLGLSMNETGEGGESGVQDPQQQQQQQQQGPSSQSNGLVGRFDASKSSLLSARNRQRLSTVKSAFLIYCALLGLSPILKSLTKSTASDSIWTLSCWLLIINIFSFDYGSGEGAGATNFPASLSTNAAVMASTVLASRLPSTTHVFSLMLFSMEVFGLFPIFRRQLRHISWTGHVFLTLVLVIVAGGAVGITLRGGWMAAVVGSILGSMLTALTMGGCSWWLISLQKYKNVVIGPWDPARPIIRRWD